MISLDRSEASLVRMAFGGGLSSQGSLLLYFVSDIASSSSPMFTLAEEFTGSGD